MFAKNYRLHRIFNNPVLRAVKIANSQLFAAIAALVCFDVIILLSWLLSGPYEILNPMRPVCTSTVSYLVNALPEPYHLLNFVVHFLDRHGTPSGQY
jgi:hypothetical protein